MFLITKNRYLVCGPLWNAWQICCLANNSWFFTWNPTGTPQKITGNMGKSHEFFGSSILKIMGPNSAEDGGNTNPLILNGRNQPIACNHHADSSQHNLWVSTWVRKEIRRIRIGGSLWADNQ